MDEDYKNEAFEGLKIKASVAQKFRNYCKKLAKSQSAGLALMLEFSENNGRGETKDIYIPSIPRKTPFRERLLAQKFMSTSEIPSPVV